MRRLALAIALALSLSLAAASVLSNLSSGYLLLSGISIEGVLVDGVVNGVILAPSSMQIINSTNATVSLSGGANLVIPSFSDGYLREATIVAISSGRVVLEPVPSEASIAFCNATCSLNPPRLTVEFDKGGTYVVKLCTATTLAFASWANPWILLALLALIIIAVIVVKRRKGVVARY